MKRRRAQLLVILTAVALFAAPLDIEAQQAGKVYVVGLLSAHSVPAFIPERLRDVGWIEGKNLLIERASAEGREDRLPELAEKLVRRGVDIIWVSGPPPALAAARATKTIPIVFWGVSLPVELGLVKSFARPGGNVTGVAFSPGPELMGKQLELLTQIAPDARRVAWILQDTAGAWVAVLEGAAQRLRLDLGRYIMRRREDIDEVFAAVTASRAEAIGLIGSPLMWRERKRIVEFANRNRLASTFGMKAFVEVGGLISYGPDIREAGRQSALYVDKILRGARPADLPVEQPLKYELVINLGTAKILGLTIPQSMLFRADEIIE